MKIILRYLAGFCMFMASVSGLTGCSYVSAKKIPIEAKEKEGFPFYMKKPLLVVSNDQVNVLWIDDHTNLWAVKIGAVLAKNKSKMEFTADGHPTKIEADLEDDAIALKFLDITKDVLTEAIKGKLLGDGVAGAGATGKFQIFEIVYSEQTGAFVGLKPLISPSMFDGMLTVLQAKPVSGTGVEAAKAGKVPHPTPPPGNKE